MDELGNVAVMDEPIVSDPILSGDEGSEPTVESEPEGREPVVEEGKDNRAVPPAVKAFLTQASQDPANAKVVKAIKDALYSAADVRKEFPGGGKEARELRAMIEQHGGKDGLAGIEQERAAWDRLDSLYEAGDPQFVNSIAEENPQALVKMIPAAMQAFQKIDQPGFDHYISGIFANVFRTANIPMHMMQMEMLAGDNPKLLGLVKGMQDWFKNWDNLATNAPEHKIDPDRQKLDDDRKQLDTERHTSYVQQETELVKSQISSILESRIKASAKGKSIMLNPETKESFNEECVNRIKNLAKNDELFSKQERAFDSQKNYKGLRALYSKHISGFANKAFEQTYRIRYGTGKPVVPVTKAAPVVSGNGASKVSERPSNHEIDSSRTTSAMILKHTAYLNDQGAKKFGTRGIVSW